MTRYLQYTIIAILLIVLQSTIVPYMAVEGVKPDIVIIYIIIITLREGQLPGTVAGFTIGLLSDLSAGGFLGLGALTKTVVGFTSGFFHNENQPVQPLISLKFFFIVGGISLVHNLIYFAFYLQGASVGLLDFFIRYVLGFTVYTLLVAIIPFLRYTYKYQALR